MSEQSRNEGYPADWAKLVLMVSPKGVYHAIGGDQEPGDPRADRAFIGMERLRRALPASPVEAAPSPEQMSQQHYSPQGLDVPRRESFAEGVRAERERAEQMRLTLIGQVHELIDIAERHAWTKDDAEKRRTLGAIEHARKVTAPYNYNGASPAPQSAAPTDDDMARLAGKIASTAKVIQKIRGCSEREAVQRAIEAMEPFEPPTAGVSGTLEDVKQ